MDETSELYGVMRRKVDETRLKIEVVTKNAIALVEAGMKNKINAAGEVKRLKLQFDEPWSQ